MERSQAVRELGQATPTGEGDDDLGAQPKVGGGGHGAAGEAERDEGPLGSQFGAGARFFRLVFGGTP